MSYKVLARKWRPHNFSEVIGQEHVLTALSNGLTQNRVHHAYLFSGTRGVGKTSIARILAKSLNCEQGVTATPCGQCEFCLAIDAGHFVDLLEIDAASRTKVDDTREMLDNVQYKPTVGRYKVYLIDEVHMLSKHSFNALLKTLEEPPEYVKFLLATTDPQKLPITVLSRCLQFHLKALLPEQIEKQLRYILDQEQATFDGASLTAIANAADGSMRDALSLTDQALAFGSGHIEYQAVLKMLGTIDNHHLHYLLHFIASGDVEKVFAKIQEFVHLGADFAKLHQELATLCHQTALLQMLNRPHDVKKSTLQLFADRLSAEELQLYYQIAVQGYKDYAFAPNGKIAFEMTVMRLLAFKPAQYLALDESQLGLLGEANAEIKSIESTPVPSPQVTVSPQAMPIEVSGEKTSTAPVLETEMPDFHASQPDSQSLQADFQTTQNEVPILAASRDERVMPMPVENTFVEQPLHQEISPAESALNINTMAPQQAENFHQDLEVAPSPDSQDPVLLAKKSVEQLTHSRNMLRSHRLKRAAPKKPLATTLATLDAVVVAPVEKNAPHVTLSKHNVNERALGVKEAPLQRVEHSNALSVATNSIVMPDQQNIVIAEHLPAPIESRVEQDQDDFVQRSTAQSEFIAPAYFIIDANEDVQIDGAQYVEDKLTDPWSLLILQMKLVGLVKLLAKNCVFKQVNEQVLLTLCRAQQHLLNNGQLCEQLQRSLKAHLGEQTTMYIEVGEVAGQLSAFELESNIFQKCIDQAKQTICDDPNIQKFVTDFDAKIYANSIIPL